MFTSFIFTRMVAISWVGLLASALVFAEQSGGGPQGSGARPDQPSLGRGRTGPRDLGFRGRITTDGAYELTHPIIVRLEGTGFNLIETAFTNSVGDFVLREMQRGTEYFVVVNVEGFEPVRERVEVGVGGYRDVTIFLRPQAGQPKDASRPLLGDPNVVDLSQLQVSIPEEAMDEYEAAREDSAEGDDRRAVERLERAVSLAPDFYEAQNDLGLAYLWLERYEEAERRLRRASELNASGAEPLIGLGLLYVKMGDSQTESGDALGAERSSGQAVSLLQEATKRNPLSARAHYYLGAAHYRLRHHERAESSLQRALQLSSQIHEARLMLVNVYVKQGRFEQALEQLAIYLEEFPDSPQTEAVERTRIQLEQFRRQQ